MEFALASPVLVASLILDKVTDDSAVMMEADVATARVVEVLLDVVLTAAIRDDAALVDLDEEEDDDDDDLSETMAGMVMLSIVQVFPSSEVTMEEASTPSPIDNVDEKSASASRSVIVVFV